MKIFLLLFFSILSINAQNRNPFYIGHSLVNFNMPAMVQGMALNAGKTTNYGSQIANGSPLHINYNNYATAQGTPYPNAFPSGNYNSLIITEAVPLQPHLTWSDTNLMANNFYNYAKNNNNGNPIKFYVYETWHCKNSGKSFQQILNLISLFVFQLYSSNTLPVPRHNLVLSGFNVYIAFCLFNTVQSVTL